MPLPNLVEHLGQRWPWLPCWTAAAVSLSFRTAVPGRGPGPQPMAFDLDVDELPCLHSALHRGGANWGWGLDLPPPSGFAHIVKHRGPM